MAMRSESGKRPRLSTLAVLLIAYACMAMAAPVSARAAATSPATPGAVGISSASDEWPELDNAVDAVINGIAGLPMLRDNNIHLGRNLEVSDAQFDNNLVTIGQRLSVRKAMTKGSLVAVGVSVAVEGVSTDQSVLALGRNLDVSDTTAESVVAIGGTVSVGATCNDLAIYADVATIDGVVNGDVAVSADSVVIGSRAQVNGTLYVCSPNRPLMRKGARVSHVEFAQLVDESQLGAEESAAGSANGSQALADAETGQVVSNLGEPELTQLERPVSSGQPGAGAAPAQSAHASQAVAFARTLRPAVSLSPSAFADDEDNYLSFADDEADAAEEAEAGDESDEDAKGSVVELVSGLLVFMAVMGIVAAVLNEVVSAFLIYVAILSFLGVVVTAVLAEWMFRRQTARAAEMVRRRTVPTIVSGVVGTIVIIPLVILLAFLGVTLPVAGGVAFAVLALSSVATGFMGASIFRLAFKDLGRFRCALAGGAIMGVIGAIPYLGFVAQVVAFVYLLGYVLQSLYLSMPGSSGAWGPSMAAQEGREATQGAPVPEIPVPERTDADECQDGRPQASDGVIVADGEENPRE